MNPWIMKRRNPEVTRKIVAEYKAGATGTELAAKYGCAVSTIYRILKLAGVRRRRTGPPEGVKDRLAPEGVKDRLALERVKDRLAGDPTPEEIAERAAAIRKTWGHVEGDDD